MNPRSFSLEREAQALRLRLQLEAEDGGKCWVLLWLPLSLLAAERDPFSRLRIPAARRSCRNGAMAARPAMGRLDGVSAGRERKVATGAHG
jgi:hypothetical protein